MKKIALIAGLILLLYSHAQGACRWVGNTGTPGSNSVSEVSSCLSDASSKTGEITIQLNSGATTWGSTLNVNMSTGYSNVTSLTIIGSGALEDRGAATAGGTTINISGGVNAFYVTGQQTKKVRLSNITFTGGSSTNNAAVYITGTSRPDTGGGFRIDHNSYYNLNCRGNWVSGYTYGVIDSNIHSGQYQFTIIRDDGYSGNAAWHRNIALGTSNAVYLENNQLTNTGSSERMVGDVDNGGRIVYRHNDITNMYLGGHDCSSVGRSIFSFEIYNNAITAEREMGDALDIRGGTGVVYNNNIRTTGGGSFYAPVIFVRNYRSFDYGSVAPWTDGCDNNVVKICAGTKSSPKVCTSDSDCGGESGACVNIDGNIDGSGYPCRDQIGRTKTASSDQGLQPALFWNNTLNGSPINPVVESSGRTKTHIILNRDYCQDNTTMPSSCNGVTTSYRAFAYPHPLRGDGGGELRPPGNLRLQ